MLNGSQPPSLAPLPNTPTSAAAKEEEEEDILMDSPSGSMGEDDVSGLDPPRATSLLHPAQELVGGRTQHVQIMKASFFTSKEDLNLTYSIQTPRLHPPLSTSSRPDSRLDDSFVVRPSSRGPGAGVTASAHPSPFSRSMLQNAPYQTSTAAPSPSQLIHDQAPPTAEPLDPFTKFHRSRRPLVLPPAQMTPLQAQSAVLMAKRNLNVLVPLTDRKDRILCDLGLFLGRSFRVGWGPNWTLAHSGVLISPAAAESAAKGWSQGGLFSSVAPRQSVEDRGHPIRVVLEQVSVNQSPKTCDLVSQVLTYCLGREREREREREWGGGEGVGGKGRGGGGSGMRERERGGGRGEGKKGKRGGGGEVFYSQILHFSFDLAIS